MNKSKLSKIIISWLLVCLWLGVIYQFSSKTAPVSSNSSSRVVEFLNQFIHANLDDPATLHTFVVIVRKGAHIFEYAVLFSLLMNACYFTFPAIYLPSYVLTLGFAMIDEFHQLFVSGRSGQISDVGVDMIGATLALIVIYYIRKLIIRRKQND